MVEGSFEVKLPTSIWTDGKAEVRRVGEEKRREEKRRLVNNILQKITMH
jgi:hypothetical protein